MPETPPVAKSCADAPTEASESNQDAPDVGKDVGERDSVVFIPPEPLLPSDERPQIGCSPDQNELREAKRRSEEIWSSWVKNSSRHGVKRGAPKNFSEARQKVIAADNQYFDCLQGLSSLNLPDTSSDDSDHSHEVNASSPVGVPTCPPEDPSMSCAPVQPMMREVRLRSGSLCGILPLQKKLCERVATPEACKPSTPVIGGDNGEASNEKQA